MDDRSPVPNDLLAAPRSFFRLGQALGLIPPEELQVRATEWEALPQEGRPPFAAWLRSRGAITPEGFERAVEAASRRAFRCSACGAEGDLLAEGALPDACFVCGALWSPAMLADCVPKRVGRYTTIRTIARGGMGVVVEAQDPSLGRRVALKLLPSLACDPLHVERLRREATIAARLRHPNIVTVHEVGFSEGIHYIALDLIDGVSLDKAWGEGRARGPAGLALLAKVARAVHHAHERGIVHRDLKPGNVLVDGGGEPFVCDFGIARDQAAVSDLTRSGTIIGSMAYMSPEQADGRGVDARSDVYSMGVMLYELLAGRRPFEEDAPFKLYARILHQAPASPRRHDPSVGRDAEAVVLRALEKRPKDRYADAAALADDVERLRDGRPTAARPAGWVRRGVRGLRRHRRWLAAGLAAAVAVLLAREWRPEDAGAAEATIRRAMNWGGQRASSPGAATRGEIDEAREILRDLEELARRNPADPHPATWSGMMLAALDRPDEALGWLDRALESAPDHVPARLERGRLRVERAEERLRRAWFPRMRPDPEAAALAAAAERDLSGAPPTAMRDRLRCRSRCARAWAEQDAAGLRAASADVEDPKARFYAALASGEARACDEALRLDPASIEAALLRARLRREAGDRAGAREAAEVLAARRPDDGPVRAARAEAWEDDGDFAAAEREWTEAIRCVGEEPWPRFQRGRVRRRLGDAGGALEDFDAAARVRPEWGDLRYARAQVLREAGRLPEAADELREAAPLLPASAQLSAELGELLLNTGRPDEAAAALGDALRLGPPAIEVLLLRTRALLRAGRLDEARGQALEAVRLAPGEASAWGLLALCELRRLWDR